MTSFFAALFRWTFLLLSVSSGFAHAADSPVSVKVDADRPVTVSHHWRTDPSGFKRLELSLRNDGEETLTISHIEMGIPIEGGLDPAQEVLFGSSGMGRRPMQRRTVGEPDRRSESFMYQMVRFSTEDHLFIGSLSWRIFMPIFSVELDRFVIRSEGEGKQLKPGESIDYEDIVMTRSADWVELLEEFGEAIAAENNIAGVKDVAFTGWATWDYYGRLFTPADIFGNIEELEEINPSANLIQIDGGWWTERGDYTSVRLGLVGGVEAIADRIKTLGMTAGLHFDGFRADLASTVYRENPDFFLHDQDGVVIVQTKQLADREMNYIYFDYSHPGARAHIAECVRTMREWGITYFKVDFMRYGLESEVKGANPNLIKVVAHDPTLTGVERFRLGMQTIRAAIGEENYFLGCSAVFGPCIGFVDGMRTGGDIHPRFEAFPERVLANSGNFYLTRNVFNGDSDYLVFREAEDEDETIFKSNHKYGGSLPMNEARMWADYNKLYGNCRLASDNLMTLRPERRDLVREVMAWPAMDETIPLDVWAHATTKTDGFELLLARHGDDIYLGVFNWDDEPKSYELSAFDREETVDLAARHSAIVKYGGSKKFEQLKRSFP